MDFRFQAIEDLIKRVLLGSNQRQSDTREDNNHNVRANPVVKNSDSAQTSLESNNELEISENLDKNCDSLL